MDKTTETAIQKVKQAVVDLVDVNGDGEIGVEDIVSSSLRIPGIRVNREAFLRSELLKHYPNDVVDDAVRDNPMRAGISTIQIDKIANHVIEVERKAVAGIAALLGAPGGFAMMATIPADLVQYYGYTLRAA